ncbi:MAG: hypothetical protein QOI81_860, partial [Actinomycetota bacterium]|nr:hypothetical protein [Actinomycetota bacterium]
METVMMEALAWFEAFVIASRA